MTELRRSSVPASVSEGVEGDEDRCEGMSGLRGAVAAVACVTAGDMREA